MANKDITILIVNYNTESLLRDCLESLIKNTQGIDYEVIVVDNNSKDGSCDMLKKSFPEVRLIKNRENYGFSKANNIGIAAARGEYILLLNSDTLVEKGCINKCLSYIKRYKNIGALGCKVMLLNGKLDHACKRGFATPLSSLFYMLKLSKLFPKSKFFSKYTLSYLPDDKINEVDCVTGAFLLFPRRIVDEVGTLDERFFMYSEDVDFCYRVKEHGYRVVYYPKAKILHLKGGSNSAKSVKILFEFYRSMLLFYDKHYRYKYNFLVRVLVYICVYSIFAVKLIVNLVRKVFRGRL